MRLRVLARKFIWSRLWTRELHNASTSAML